MVGLRLLACRFWLALWGASLPGVQTRYLLVASAVMALVILAAGAAWLLLGFM